MKSKTRNSIIVFLLTSIIVFTQTYSICEKVIGQTNLVEEENEFKIFAGNFFELIVPKGEGPTAIFSYDTIGDIILKFNYISEYESNSVFMNSLNSLSGKGYSLDQLDWNTVGTSDAYKSSVNFSKVNLDRNASIDLSFTVYNQNSTVNFYDVEHLSQSFMELNLSDWDYTPNSRGIALNIETYLSNSNNYIRRGPYMNFETSYYYVEIISGDYTFKIQFKPHVLIKNHYGVEDFYESNYFAPYNPSADVTEPADFWISVPYRYDITNIVFSFLCYCETTTEEAGIEWFSLSFIALSGFCTIFILKRRRE